MIVRKALKEQLITKNPFDIFSMPKYRDPEKSFLSKEQIETLDKLALKNPEWHFAGTWFVIGCYTGLRFKDMTRFSKKNIWEDRLVVRTHKQKVTVSMPLTNKLKSLFERIGYKGLDYTNYAYSRVIKRMAKKAEIGNISAHTSRHSFGTLCANAGISQEVTAKLMGHKDLKSTSIYYQITNQRIDKEIEKIF